MRWAGERAFVDFSGSRLCLTDPRTGEKTPVEMFVGVFGASSYIYADASLTQCVSDWIRPRIHMFEGFAGCPEILVPDILKSAVRPPDRYEAEVNRSYSEMAAYYGAMVIPARVRKPRDRAKVEVSVRVLQRWIVARLRNRTFFSLAGIYQAIRVELERVNQRPMRGLNQSRRERLEAACTRAERLGAPGYRTVKNILQSRLDLLLFEVEAERSSGHAKHDNIRGASYHGGDAPEATS